MSTTNTPNMNLPIPGVGNEAGPDYADDVNNCLTILDGHSHATGSGVQITPNALNLNSDVTFLGNNATTLRSVRMSSQSGALSGGSDLGCLYNNAGELYYNDGSGNHVAITASGGVAGSPGSIANLVSPASATYTAGSKLFTWASGTSGKAAAMDNGAITIRQTDTASAKGITLASPNALAADYQLTMPTAVPGSTQYMSSDSSGNLGFATPDTIGSSMTSTGSNAISVARTRATGTTVGTGGVAISASSGMFVTSSTSEIDVTNLTVTITTSGRPVLLGLMSDGTFALNCFQLTSSVSNVLRTGFIYPYRGSTIIGSSFIGGSTSTLSDLVLYFPPSVFYFIDDVAAGTYTYKFRTVVSNAQTSIGWFHMKMIAYEL